MKNIELVIQISEETYEHFLSRYKYQDANDTWLGEAEKVGVAIKNGKPLDAVLDEIRAEIESAYEDLDGYDPDALPTYIDRVGDIIDKYKEGVSENEYEISR